MKALLVVSVACAVLVAGIALADRTDVVLSSSAKWTHYTVAQLPDGGLSVELCARAYKTDGGVVDSDCDSADVPPGAIRNALQNAGDNIINRWKTRLGL